MIHDFTACNSNELTIRRGQTVEVLERPHDKPDWCLVRTTDRSPAAEGLVPCGSLCIAHSRSSMEMEGIFNHKGERQGGLRGCSELSAVEMGGERQGVSFQRAAVGAGVEVLTLQGPAPLVSGEERAGTIFFQFA